jgi:hypothetical protein
MRSKFEEHLRDLIACHEMVLGIDPVDCTNILERVLFERHTKQIEQLREQLGRVKAQIRSNGVDIPPPA